MPTCCWSAAQLGLHLLAQLQVEGAQGLVEEQHAGPVHEGPGQGHALPLAARELRRAGARPGPGRRTRSSTSAHAPLALRPRAPSAPAGHRPRSRPRHVGEERVVLEDGVHVALVGRHAHHGGRAARSCPRWARRSRRSGAGRSSCRSPTGRAARRTRPSADLEAHPVERPHVAEVPANVRGGGPRPDADQRPPITAM